MTLSLPGERHEALLLLLLLGMSLVQQQQEEQKAVRGETHLLRLLSFWGEASGREGPTPLLLACVDVLQLLHPVAAVAAVAAVA